MPSARRRRFSVHNKISNQETNKSQNETQISKQDEINLLQNMNSLKYKAKINPSTSKKLSLLEIVTECKSVTSVIRVHENNTITSDKEVTASSSNINLYTVLNSPNVLSVNESTEINNETKQREHYQRDKTPHRDKHLHRVKVRSPRRKVSYMNKEIKKKSIGIGVQLNNYNEKEHRNENEIIKQVIDVGENTECEEEEISSHSLEDMCRICHSGDAVSDAGNLISACLCRGTIGRVHVKCLERWLTESGNSRCELCGTKYVTRRVHRFGILKAFIMWILSHNSKNMIVDFFGIMIMTPIAVVGAGLTERTFTGLMAQDHQTPWPLASTFVLACMTLPRRFLLADFNCFSYTHQIPPRSHQSDKSHMETNKYLLISMWLSLVSMWLLSLLMVSYWSF